MVFWPVLLRVLLSISLILNGSGYAMASMPMPMPMKAEDMQQVANAPEQQLQPVCHESANAPLTAPEAKAADVPVEQGPAKPKPHSPDCCKSGGCRCLCGHHAPAVIAVLIERDGVVERASNSRSATTSHPAPALPHLIRPPIG